MNKMTNCKACGAEIAASAKICPFCGMKNKQPVYKRVWFWLLMIFVVIPTLGGIIGGGGENDEQTAFDTKISSPNNAVITEPSNSVVTSQSSVFNGECGIEASAEMGSSIIESPELTISIKNTTHKDISAIQFYVVPYDVYGDEITGWMRQNKLYTDTSIGVGKSTSIKYQFLDDNVKTVKLYVYSVYYSDGSEWGDKNATRATILDSGMLIEVAGES